MILLSILNNKYKHPESWKEVTIKKAVELWSYASAIPLEYLKTYQLQSEEPKEDRTKKKIDDELFDLNVSLECSGVMEAEVYNFQRNVVSCIMNIKSEIIIHVPHRGEGSIEQIYKLFTEKFVLDLLSEHSTYDSNEFYEYFEFKKDRYYLPAIEETLGKLKLLANTTIEEYANASDVMLVNSENEKAKLRTCGYNLKENRYNNLGLLIAILCRKKGEEFNETEIVRRGKEFEDLPVNIAFTVFFYLLKHGSLYLQYINMLSLRVEVRATRKRIRRSVT